MPLTAPPTVDTLTRLSRPSPVDTRRTSPVEVLRSQAVLDPSITVGAAFDLYHDAERGPLASFSGEWQKAKARYRARWEAFLGPERPWNEIRNSDLRAYVRKRQREGCGLRGIETEIKALASIAVFLQSEEYSVRNPAAVFLKNREWRDLRASHEPARERYTRAEVESIRTAAWKVDPRLGLLVALADETGERVGTLMRLTRACVDAPLPANPERAPYGWIVFPGRAQSKRKRQRIVFLTHGARKAIDLALGLHLEMLERLFQASGTDYPLFPCGRIHGGLAMGMKPLERGRMLTLLRLAEKRAKVAHVPKRAFHGFRRNFVDELTEMGADEDTLTAAGGWTSSRMARDVYRARETHAQLAKIREMREQAKREEDAS